MAIKSSFLPYAKRKAKEHTGQVSSISTPLSSFQEMRENINFEWPAGRRVIRNGNGQFVTRLLGFLW